MQTKDNTADVFTKNMVGDLYDKHTSELEWKSGELDNKNQGWLPAGRVLDSIVNILEKIICEVKGQTKKKFQS